MKFSGWMLISVMPLLITPLALTGCASKALKYEKEAQLSKNEEFDKAVTIEHTESPIPDTDEDVDGVNANSTETKKNSSAPVSAPAPAATPSPLEKKAIKGSSKSKSSGKTSTKAAVTSKNEKASKPDEKAAASSEPAAAAAPGKREPDLEDDTGFNGRRPVVDPFRVGEVVTHNVHYFKVSAGTMKLKVAPMVNVNGRKAYNFVTEIKSSSMFSSVYSVDDKVENFVDFESLVPRVFTLHVKETSQLREARMIFDEKTLKATYWEKKVTEKNGEETKKQTWDILPYSQNVFSAAFYMRVFQWDVGKEISFRVADDEQNLVFKGKCLRRETLDTVLGPKKALVIKPEVTLKGAFKPVGDIYIWLSDDEHKHVLRIESKIKIGTIISEVTSIKPGRN